MAAILGKQLSSWAVLPGGTQVAIDVTTLENSTQRIVLPVDTLSALLMTLPRMLQTALDHQFPDSSLRFVQQLGDWRVEQQERKSGLVLKLKTSDGFEVAFLLDDQAAGSLGNALVDAPQHRWTNLMN